MSSQEFDTKPKQIPVVRIGCDPDKGGEKLEAILPEPATVIRFGSASPAVLFRELKPLFEFSVLNADKMPKVLDSPEFQKIQNEQYQEIISDSKKRAAVLEVVAKYLGKDSIPRQQEEAVLREAAKAVCQHLALEHGFDSFKEKRISSLYDNLGMLVPGGSPTFCGVVYAPLIEQNAKTREAMESMFGKEFVAANPQLLQEHRDYHEIVSCRFPAADMEDSYEVYLHECKADVAASLVAVRKALCERDSEKAAKTRQFLEELSEIRIDRRYSSPTHDTGRSIRQALSEISDKQLAGMSDEDIAAYTIDSVSKSTMDRKSFEFFHRMCVRANESKN